MPSYDYKCKHCQSGFLTVCKYEDRDKQKCPECKKKVKRQISAPTFHEKGKKRKWVKADITRVLNECIEDTKERLNTKKSPYSKYKMDQKFMKGNGLARPSTTDEISRRLEISKQQTAAANELLRQQEQEKKV